MQDCQDININMRLCDYILIEPIYGVSGSCLEVLLKTVGLKTLKNNYLHFKSRSKVLS